MINTERNLIVAIEAAFDGGSLSIFEGRSEVDFWIGTSGLSKAEDILEGVAGLLGRNNLKREQIGLVAVSGDAGSLTGLKIGAATAQGLAKALDCDWLVISLWTALAETLTADSDEAVNVLLPGGKNTLYRRTLRNRKTASEIELMSTTDQEKLGNDLGELRNDKLYAHRKIIRDYNLGANFPVIDLGENLAVWIGTFASDNEEM